MFVPNWGEGVIEKVAARVLGTKFRHALVLRMLVCSIWCQNIYGLQRIIEKPQYLSMCQEYMLRFLFQFPGNPNGEDYLLKLIGNGKTL